MQTAAMMGYSESEFWDMTPRFFAAATKGWERNNRDAWERTRSIVVATIAPNWDKKKNGALTAEKAMPLPWDKKTEFVTWTKEEYSELHERRKIKMQARRLHKFDGKTWQQ